MPNSILVTGGTGTLGRAVVSRLDAAEHRVRVLSRKRPPAEPASHETVHGDLLTGAGITEAVADVDVIVHCATSNGRRDVTATRHLIDAARSETPPHLMYVSIVGCDRIPLGYYRAKQECERLVEASGLPWTIVRVTQFHDLLAAIFAAQRRLPFVVVPSGPSFQPIDVHDVADHLTQIAGRAPAGRAPDLGGPQIRTLADLARTYRQATGRRPKVLQAPIPGRIVRGYRQGRHLAPDNIFGHTTFEQFLSRSSETSR